MESNLEGMNGIISVFYTILCILAFVWGIRSVIAENNTQHVVLYEDERDDGPITDNDWDIICRQAIEKAVVGTDDHLAVKNGRTTSDFGISL